MMPMRIFEDRNRVGAYLVMFVVGAAMFGMFYFITFFTQLVLEFGPLKTGVAFLPVAFTIGITSQVAARILMRVGPKVLLVIGTTLLTLSLLWLSTVTVDSTYLTKLLPGMIMLAIAMGCLFVPLTSTAVANVANTDAGLASALLNVGQQVGGALGLSVMATVFATASRNYATRQPARQAVRRSAPTPAGAAAARRRPTGQGGQQRPAAVRRSTRSCRRWPRTTGRVPHSSRVRTRTSRHALSRTARRWRSSPAPCSASSRSSRRSC